MPSIKVYTLNFLERLKACDVNFKGCLHILFLLLLDN